MSTLTDTLQQVKASFIEYVLFQYRFKSRISVWVLNLIKSSPELLQKIYFVDEQIPSHNTLEISAVNTDNIAIKLKVQNQQYINNEKIFDYIANQNIYFDIKLYLNNEGSRDTRLDELLLTQLLHSPYYAIYIQDIYGLPLSKQSESSIIKYLQDNIDFSLQLQDKALFYQLSQILNTFKLRNLNTLSKD